MAGRSSTRSSPRTVVGAARWCRVRARISPGACGAGAAPAPAGAEVPRRVANPVNVGAQPASRCRAPARTPQIFHRPRPSTCSRWYSRTYVRSAGRPRWRRSPTQSGPTTTSPTRRRTICSAPTRAWPSPRPRAPRPGRWPWSWTGPPPAPRLLSAAELVDAAIGYEHLAAWATAGQQVMLAEFHRRPADGTVRPAATSADPAGESAARREWAVDEIGLALTLAPSAAATRMAHADRAAAVLRPTRDLLAAGRISPDRARLIADMLAEYDDGVAEAVQTPGAGAGPRADLGAAAGGAHPGHRRGRARSCRPSPEGASTAAGRVVARS